MNSKKYQLKPGVHQFAPGSHPEHHAGNLSDEEAEWYLERYPHITALFIPPPPEGGEIDPERNEGVIDGDIKTNLEHLTPPSGGWGAA